MRRQPTEDAVEAPSLTTFQPRPALRSRVSAIDVIELGGGEATVLPQAGAVLGFQFRGRVQTDEGLLSVAGVTGIQQAARRYGYVGETGSVLVRFTPQGAACLGLPAHELTGRSVALDQIIAPARAREAYERLLASPGPEARVAAVEELLLGMPFVVDRLVERAIELLAATDGGDASVAAVARALELSERQLERRVLSRVGLTPKRLARLLRFERAVALARTTASLTAVALAAGYADQSHFIREFRRFSGAPPGAILRRPR